MTAIFDIYVYTYINIYICIYIYLVLNPPLAEVLFAFFLKAATQLARLVQQERTQVVCSNKVGLFFVGAAQRPSLTDNSTNRTGKI